MYRQTRQCWECGLEEERDLSALEAAFEHGRVWKSPCSKCGSTRWRSGSTQGPPLSAEQLAVWATNKKIHFSSQDEDILLARPESLPLLLQCLDDSRTLKSKRMTLLAALYVIVYDRLGPGRSEPLVVSRVVSALREREATITELGTRHIPGYIRRRVTPAIRQD